MQHIVVTYVSTENDASGFCEGGGSSLLQNVSTYLPINTASISLKPLPIICLCFTSQTRSPYNSNRCKLKCYSVARVFTFISCLPSFYSPVWAYFSLPPLCISSLSSLISILVPFPRSFFHHSFSNPLNCVLLIGVPSRLWHEASLPGNSRDRMTNINQLIPSRWRQKVPPKRWYISVKYVMPHAWRKKSLQYSENINIKPASSELYSHLLSAPNLIGFHVFHVI
jgi:hypothetical protein